MLSKVVLGFVSFAFISYGLVCLFSPEIPADYIGYALTNVDSVIEVVAMYGGLQTGLGIFVLLGILSPQYERPALLSVVLMLGGLGISRSIALLLSSDPATVYTHGAIVFELGSMAVAAYALVKSKQAAS